MTATAPAGLAATATDANRPAPDAVEVRLLDGFAVECGGKRFPLPHSVQRVVAFLALHDRRLLRGYVAGRLWPDAAEPRAAASLRSALWRLHRHRQPIVAAGVGTIGLAAGVGVDVHRVVATAHQLLTGQAPLEANLRFTRLTGALLPDWYEEWVLLEREQLHQLSLHALEALASRLSALGRHGQAVEAALAAVAGEPLRESAHRALTAAHLAEGNVSEALRQYERYRRLLETELGVKPSPLFHQLLASIPRLTPK